MSIRNAPFFAESGHFVLNESDAPSSNSRDRVEGVKRANAPRDERQAVSTAEDDIGEVLLLTRCLRISAPVAASGELAADASKSTAAAESRMACISVKHSSCVLVAGDGG